MPGPDDQRAEGAAAESGTSALPQRRGSGKPTLKTIADISGLAVPTVSRALNDAHDIGAATKELVRKIATEIGYVPNRAGVRLRTGRTNVIALVLHTDHELMTHTARLIASLSAGLRGSPFHLIITPFSTGDDPMKPIRYIVETGSADGMVFNMIEPEDERVAWLMEKGFPFATHGRTLWSDRHAWWDFDNDAFARIGVERMARRGRRKVLVLAPPLRQNYAQHIVTGATAAAQQAGMDLHIAQSVTSDSPSAAIRAFVAERLSSDPAIDAIICSSPPSAMAAVAGLELAGRRLGDDIDVFAKEAIPFLQLFRDKMLVVEEDVRQAGEFLARAAIQAVREPTLPPLQGLETPRDDG